MFLGGRNSRLLFLYLFINRKIKELNEALTKSLTEGNYGIRGACVCAKSLQEYPTLRSPMHHNPQRLPVPWGALQARILEWFALLSSRVSSPPRD